MGLSREKFRISVYDLLMGRFRNGSVPPASQARFALLNAHVDWSISGMTLNRHKLADGGDKTKAIAVTVPASSG
jgi:hypothetical protein